MSERPNSDDWRHMKVVVKSLLERVEALEKLPNALDAEPSLRINYGKLVEVRDE